MTSPNSRVERISFSPPIKLLTLGKAEQFTIEGKPDGSILQPQRLVCSSPCEKFVFITRIKMGEQVHLQVTGQSPYQVDSFHLRRISESIIASGGFHTLSTAHGVEYGCIYTGLVPESFEKGHDYHWKISVCWVLGSCSLHQE